jgi:hypothetical protein
MTERVCINMDKIDQLLTEVHKIDKNVTEIKTKLEYTEKLLNEKINNHDERLDKLEGNQRWVVITVLGYFLLQIMNLVRGL